MIKQDTKSYKEDSDYVRDSTETNSSGGSSSTSGYGAQKVRRIHRAARNKNRGAMEIRRNPMRLTKKDKDFPRSRQRLLAAKRRDDLARLESNKRTKLTQVPYMNTRSVTRKMYNVGATYQAPTIRDETEWKEWPVHGMHERPVFHPQFGLAMEYLGKYFTSLDGLSYQEIIIDRPEIEVVSVDPHCEFFTCNERKRNKKPRSNKKSQYHVENMSFEKCMHDSLHCVLGYCSQVLAPSYKKNVHEKLVKLNREETSESIRKNTPKFESEKRDVAMNFSSSSKKNFIAIESEKKDVPVNLSKSTKKNFFIFRSEKKDNSMNLSNYSRKNFFAFETESKEISVNVPNSFTNDLFSIETDKKQVPGNVSDSPANDFFIIDSEKKKLSTNSSDSSKRNFFVVETEKKKIPRSISDPSRKNFSTNREPEKKQTLLNISGSSKKDFSVVQMEKRKIPINILDPSKNISANELEKNQIPTNISNSSKEDFFGDKKKLPANISNTLEKDFFSLESERKQFPTNVLDSSKKDLSTVKMTEKISTIVSNNSKKDLFISESEGKKIPAHISESFKKDSCESKEQNLFNYSIALPESNQSSGQTVKPIPRLFPIPQTMYVANSQKTIAFTNLKTLQGGQMKVHDVIRSKNPLILFGNTLETEGHESACQRTRVTKVTPNDVNLIKLNDTSISDETLMEMSSIYKSLVPRDESTVNSENILNDPAKKTPLKGRLELTMTKLLLNDTRDKLQATRETRKNVDENSPQLHVRDLNTKTCVGSKTWCTSEEIARILSEYNRSALKKPAIESPSSRLTTKMYTNTNVKRTNISSVEEEFYGVQENQYFGCHESLKQNHSGERSKGIKIPSSLKEKYSSIQENTFFDNRQSVKENNSDETSASIKSLSSCSVQENKFSSNQENINQRENEGELGLKSLSNFKEEFYGKRESKFSEKKGSSDRNANIKTTSNFNEEFHCKQEYKFYNNQDNTRQAYSSEENINLKTLSTSKEEFYGKQEEKYFTQQNVKQKYSSERNVNIKIPQGKWRRFHLTVEKLKGLKASNFNQKRLISSTQCKQDSTRHEEKNINNFIVANSNKEDETSTQFESIDKSFVNKTESDTKVSEEILDEQTKTCSLEELLEDTAILYCAATGVHQDDLATYIDSLDAKQNIQWLEAWSNNC